MCRVSPDIEAGYYDAVMTNIYGLAKIRHTAK